MTLTAALPYGEYILYSLSLEFKLILHVFGSIFSILKSLSLNGNNGQNTYDILLY